MKKKVLVGVLLALGLLLSSCYPELSVQQYDKLRTELEAMESERKELRVELATIKLEKAENEAKNEAKNAETLAYVEFLDTLLSAQRGVMIVYGHFDVAVIPDFKDELARVAEQLGDSEIAYYVGLIDPENEGQSAKAYYKIIECCFQKMRLNLE